VSSQSKRAAPHASISTALTATLSTAGPFAGVNGATAAFALSSLSKTTMQVPGARAVVQRGRTHRLELLCV
jgi:hypothetical protein